MSPRIVQVISIACYIATWAIMAVVLFCVFTRREVPYGPVLAPSLLVLMILRLVITRSQRAAKTGNVD